MSETRPYDIDSRLRKHNEDVLACRTKRELLQTVQRIKELAYHRGYAACEHKWLRRQASEAGALAEPAPRWEGM